MSDGIKIGDEVLIPVRTMINQREEPLAFTVKKEKIPGKVISGNESTVTVAFDVNGVSYVGEFYQRELDKENKLTSQEMKDAQINEDIRLAIAVVSPDCPLGEFLYGYWLFCTTKPLNKIAEDLEEADRAIEAFIKGYNSHNPEHIEFYKKVKGASDIARFVKESYEHLSFFPLYFKHNEAYSEILKYALENKRITADEDLIQDFWDSELFIKNRHRP